MRLTLRVEEKSRQSGGERGRAGAAMAKEETVSELYLPAHLIHKQRTLVVG